MEQRIGHLLVGVCFMVASAGVAFGSTIYVDKNFGPGGSGTQEAPYDTIQAAIVNFNSTEIIVYPGTYTENILIPKDLEIRGYDGPHTTTIDGSLPRVERSDAVTLTESIYVKLEGLKISSGRYGVYIPRVTTLRMRNCVVCGNDSHGVYIDNNDKTVEPTVILYNNVIVANGGSGLFFWARTVIIGTDHRFAPYLTARNNIVISNTLYGVETSDHQTGQPNAERIQMDFNNCVGNPLGPYDAAFKPTGTFDPGTHSMEEAPEFVGGVGQVCNKDFRLLLASPPTSPCQDKGDPGMGFLDPDGTQNDIGAYGGPGAQHFYTNPNDGPMVRSVTIDQGLVPQGETVTIRATGAVR